MKVILLNHIDKVGRKGEIVTVKRGYARNFLIPRELALYATPQNMKQLGSIQAKAEEEEQKLLAELKKLDDKIRSISLAFVRKVDENDHMFGSVSETDIQTGLQAQGVNIHKSAILMEKHIKALGESQVQIRLHRDIVSELLIKVEREAREAAPTPPEEEEVTPPSLAETEPEPGEILDEDEI